MRSMTSWNTEIQKMTDLTLTVERTIKAPPATVFEAWLNPEMLRKFMMPGAGESPRPALSFLEPSGDEGQVPPGRKGPVPHGAGE